MTTMTSTATPIAKYPSRENWNFLRGGWTTTTDGRRAYLRCQVEDRACYCNDDECRARQEDD